MVSEDSTLRVMILCLYEDLHVDWKIVVRLKEGLYSPCGLGGDGTVNSDNI